MNHAALGFGQLLDLIRSLRTGASHGTKGNRKIAARRPPCGFSSDLRGAGAGRGAAAPLGRRR